MYHYQEHGCERLGLITDLDAACQRETHRTIKGEEDRGAPMGSGGRIQAAIWRGVRVSYVVHGRCTHVVRPCQM